MAEKGSEKGVRWWSYLYIQRRGGGGGWVYGMEES